MKIERVNSVDFKTASVSVAGTVLVISSDDPSVLDVYRDPNGPWVVRVLHHPEARFLSDSISATKIDKVRLYAEKIAEAQISHSKVLPAHGLDVTVEPDGTLRVEFDTRGPT